MVSRIKRQIHPIKGLVLLQFIFVFANLLPASGDTDLIHDFV